MSELPGSGSDKDVRGERASSDPELWVSNYGDDLFRFASVRLRNVSAAEDLVQETFLAALKARDGFRGQSSEKNWLLGILKNKIADYFRQAAREATPSTSNEFLESQEALLHLSDSASEHWTHGITPKEWAAPEMSLDRQEFWDTLQNCSAKLPKNIARVYAMRELDETGTDEICSRLNISPANLWVILHRARTGLRRCLEIHWFGRQGK